MNTPARSATAVDHLASLAATFRQRGRFVSSGLSYTDDGAGGSGWVAFLAFGPRDTADDPRTHEGSYTGSGDTPDDAVIDLRRNASPVAR